MYPASRLHGAAVLAIALAFASAVLGADESAPVPKPEVKVGDTWTYQITNLLAKASRPGRIEMQVTFANTDVIVTVNRTGDGRESDSQHTSEWSGMALASGEVYDRPARFYKFPLTVGEMYPYAFETSWRGSPRRTRSEGTARVVGWEEIVVPAGKFRAVKVEAKGSFERLDAAGGGKQQWEYWYAPEIRRTVKLVYEDGAGGGNPDTKRMFELTGFKLQ